MSRPISEAKHNLAQKKKFEEWATEHFYDFSNKNIDYLGMCNKIRTYVLNEAKAHLHNNPDCACRENSEENIDNLI